MLNNFSSRADEFFLDNQAFLKEGEVKIIIFRNDGVVLYSTPKIDSKMISNIGALLGGLWQSAEQLTSYAKAGERGSFRLSYDDSSSGIYVVPMQSFLMGAIFDEILNPGRLKQKIRSLAVKFEGFMNAQSEKIVRKERKLKENPLLFQNISDGEMDNLFSFIGN